MERIVKAREYDYLERQKVISKICEEYPFVKKSVIGKSVLGKDITALKIGSASAYCLIAAAFHGSERITSNVLLMFIEDLCRAIKDNSYIEGLKMPAAMRGRGVIFLPCVNPDGCDVALLGEKGCGEWRDKISRLCNKDFAHWNANIRGVDINHNFDAGWHTLREREKNMGIFGPAPSRFGGTRPESEPETLALCDLCRTSEIRHAIALHSQGEVIYWSYGKYQPTRSRKMAEIMATSSEYALDVPHGIAEGGGFKDWFISKFSRPGFTVELGLGENPLDISESIKIYSKVREMLTLSVIM